ncbi:hypothetical protein JOC76_002455 [Neobacillus cucumis]|nr:hypothetical protein [Neobacillus cucumis]
MATESISGCPNHPGYGMFNYHKNLVLTKEGVKQRSVWELPECFKEENHNFKCGLKKWEIGKNGLIETQPFGQVQEVFISENPEVISWAEKLIITCSLFD